MINCSNLPMATQLLLWLLVASQLSAGGSITSTSISSQQQQQQQGQVLLIWYDSWRADAQETKLCVLSTKHWLIFVHDFDGLSDEDGLPTPVVRTLLYRCTNGQFQTVDLAASVSRDAVYCSGTIAFTLEKVSPSEFKFRLAAENENRLSGSFSDYLTLQMVASYANGETRQSQLLYVWTFDFWLAGKPLVDGAFDSFVNVVSRASEDFRSLEFVHQGTVRKVQSAPEFLRSAINLGAVLYSGHCDSYQIQKSIVLTNYLSKLDSLNLGLLKNAQLDPTSGQLYLHGAATARHVSHRSSSFAHSNRVSACVTLTMSGHREPYERRKPVAAGLDHSRLTMLARAFVQLTSVTADTSSSESLQCQVVGAPVRSVTLLSGLVRALLVCPIVCNHAAPRVEYVFQHSGRRLIMAAWGDDDDSRQLWLKLPHGVRIARGGHVLELPKDSLSPDLHGGHYRCTAGGVSVDFHVSILSVPRWSLGLPATVPAVEGDRLTLACVAHCSSSSESFSLTSTLTTYSGAPDDSGSSGNSGVPPLEEGASNVTRRLVTTLQVGPASQWSRGGGRRRFACTAVASVGGGLPPYATRTETRLVWLARPAVRVRAAVQCSWQHLCLVASQLEWEFSLEPGLLTSLAKAGVRVTSHVTLGGNSVTKELIQQRGWQAGLQMVQEPGDYHQARLLVRVNLAELQQLPELVDRLHRDGDLTAVFNYHYSNLSHSSADEIAALQQVIHAAKADYNGTDATCKADRSCFYSSAFIDRRRASAALNVAPAVLAGLDPALFRWRLAALLACAGLTAAVLGFAADCLVRRRRRNCRERCQASVATPTGSCSHRHDQDDLYDVVFRMVAPEERGDEERSNRQCDSIYEVVTLPGQRGWIDR